MQTMKIVQPFLSVNSYASIFQVDAVSIKVIMHSFHRQITQPPEIYSQVRSVASKIFRFKDFTTQFTAVIKHFLLSLLI